MIKMKNVCAGYGKKEVLHDVSLTVAKGSILTVAGHNGCGKSTLLNVMLGFLPVSRGEIEINGVPVLSATQKSIAMSAAYMPQIHRCPDISVGRLVLHGRFPYLSYPRKYRKQDYDAANAAMEKMGILELSESSVEELSGGMRQKVYIAMALAQQTPVIVMDEPTTYLDIGQQMKLVKLVRRLAQEGKTVVLVLHDLLLALEFSDQIAVMEDGRLLKVGTPEEILQAHMPERLFGVEIKKVDTLKGTRYYYERLEEI